MAETSVWGEKELQGKKGNVGEDREIKGSKLWEWRVGWKEKIWKEKRIEQGALSTEKWDSVKEFSCNFERFIETIWTGPSGLCLSSL